ncbi:MAG: hypothetical protein A3F82_09040 [Deltaproteobacteria bacterium RIFCSPLOWO2_12_FULL_44_12]|nr:MAG: hypothetical protein A2712_00820 [Deltaproteobacteria bacterium RIFCSPHIGHO2_01_FULL_43_49]OGQ14183.1 MAG: hypothetical protein A3D22_09790 [Deltaproteobacteria bacterium RIFCSPHIGHO2_02_FULL_44_53]OGQ27399.1 MAG: hypothetical protein A3D98_03390 [Deltaproteobacteria bacterium RIFCSPHIGHO2_12_FULL_44_21]OGQ30647.1 MAG: hypothetical protein A2979_05815 [Deltaproteobacteria bacterium RIFCSPLOWO2_01_FULL_45_74]OGQ42325.1 MAG: hypothetical protein A3I70_02305 [Deltaproteobacteria bacterium 
MILADGAREDVLRELLARGELPHIEKEIVATGTVASGITTFPSTTGPAYFPFLTGCFPGTLNVPGIRWFDKEAYADPKKKMVKFRSYVGIETFLINRDMAPHPTIFDLLPDSYNIFNSVCRGAGNRNLTKIMRIWYWYYAHLTDRWEFIDQAALKKTLKAIEKDFDFLFVVFPGIDEYSHLAHPHHEKTIEQYRFLDTAVGQIAAKLKNLNKWDDTLFWIVSDHGLSKTDTHFCVNTFLEKRGLPVFYYPKVFHRNGKKVANMVSGNGMTHLYFKNGDGWAKPVSRSEINHLDSALITDLLGQPAIDIVMVRNDEGGVDILSKRGEASLQLVGGNLKYEVKKQDPFGYENVSGNLNHKEVLEKTCHTNYPDALCQIGHLFKASRTGDIVLSATPGFDLRLKYEIPEHKGSHGSLHREHMSVPVVTNVPLPAKVLRTVDVFPTTLKLLGKNIPKAIDGASLI